jgi:outer membrane protein assembly factor BamE (lipoprotein component of BamABCDE complex)
MKTPRLNSPALHLHGFYQISRIALLAGLLAACASNLEVRGHIIDEPSLAAVKEGVDNQDSVSETLGTPSVIATFDDDVWFYVSTRQERFAFFDAKVLERQIVAVEFDGKQNVKATRRYTIAEGRPVQIVGRETPTKGKELTFLEQMFGNFGRFSGTGSNEGPGGGGGRGGGG